MSEKCSLRYALLLHCVASVGLAAERPVAVSPGSSTEMAMVEGSCPTFNWGSVAGAERYDLVVYRVEASGDSNALAEVGDSAALEFQLSLPGSVSGWTPSLDQCLDAGGRYAWTVRAVSGKGETEWSAPRLFEVLGVPSAAEVGEALALLRRYRRRQESGDTADATPAAGAVDAKEAKKRPDTDRVGIPERLAAVTRTPAGERLQAIGITAAAPGPSATASLIVDDQIHLGAASHIFKDGSVFLWNDTVGNTALGYRALASNTSGFYNNASGAYALFSNAEGRRNTASGLSALRDNTQGDNNTASGAFALSSSMTGNGNTASGAYALSSNTGGSNNTASGVRALRLNTIGHGNTGSGYLALYSNTEGYNNTAGGYRALYANDTGIGNTASGVEALKSNIEGRFNTASGHKALYANTTGWRNTASGDEALRFNTEGSHNTASGHNALRNNTTGSRNTAVGFRAGYAATGADNIFLGSGAEGLTADSHTIRIGGTTVGTADKQQNRTFINGIRGVTTGNANATPVLIDSAGQLGTVSSSRRYKEDIHDMEEASTRLLDLRPVTFRYKKEFVNGAKPVQFGLIAEEVAEVFPELVVYDAEGRPETVKYYLLSSLLLNELQKQTSAIKAQDRLNQAQARLLEAQSQKLAELEHVNARLARLEALETRPPRVAAVAERTRSSPAPGRRSRNSFSRAEAE